MTVAELIEKLKEFNQNAAVQIDTICCVCQAANVEYDYSARREVRYTGQVDSNGDLEYETVTLKRYDYNTVNIAP